MMSPNQIALVKIVTILNLQTKKLEKSGMIMAASLLRIAQLDLQMRINGVSEKEIDALSFMLLAIEQKKTPPRRRTHKRAQAREREA